MRRTLFTAVSGQLLLLAFVSDGRAQNGGTWETRAPMPVRRQELATGALAGKVYVLGGYDLDGRSTATVEVYNPATNTWAFAHSLPFAVNHNAAAVGNSTVSVPEQGKHLFMIRTTTPGGHELPAIMCTVSLQRSE